MLPLGRLPESQAIELCQQLFSPQERFAQGFYRYWREVVHQPETLAWQSTLHELDGYIQRLTSNLADPHMYTVGYEQQAGYLPVGIFGFRPLLEHKNGEQLLQVIQATGLSQVYQGNLAMAHTFSALNGHRNLVLMKYAFFCMASNAVEQGVQHIFFFMSDHRLGPIYKRLGLAFPENLAFPDSRRLVGCYTLTPEHLRDVYDTAQQFGAPIPRSPLSTQWHWGRGDAAGELASRTDLDASLS
jgi:hypothetical protein